MTSNEVRNETQKRDAQKAHRSRIPYVLSILVLGLCLGASLFSIHVRMGRLNDAVNRLAAEVEIGRDNLHSLDYSTRDWSGELSEQINDLDARLSVELDAGLREWGGALDARMDSQSGEIARQSRRLAEIMERMDELLAGIGKLRVKDTELVARLENHGQYLAGHTATLENYGQHLTDHAARLGNHDQALGSQETGLSAVEQTMAGQRDRVVRAEQALSTLGLRMEELDDLLGNVHERMSEVKGRLSKLEGASSRRDRLLRELDQSLYRLDGDVRKLESRVKRLARLSDSEFGP